MPYIQIGGLSLLLILLFSACRPNVDQEASGLNTLEEFSGLEKVHPDCSGRYPSLLSSSPKRILSEKSSSVSPAINDAVNQFFSSIPDALQKYFLDKNGYILIAENPKDFSNKTAGQILEPLDPRFLDNSVVIFFDYRNGKKEKASELFKIPTAQIPDFAFVIVLKNSADAIKKDGVRAYANFLLEAPGKLGENDDLITSRDVITNAFLTDLMVIDKEKIADISSLIGDRAQEELATKSDQPLSALSFLNRDEASNPNAASIAKSRSTRFKLAVLGHSLDSLWCTQSHSGASNHPFAKTLELTQTAVKNMMNGKQGLSLGSFSQPTINPLYMYTMIPEWQHSVLQNTTTTVSPFMINTWIQPLQTVNPLGVNPPLVPNPTPVSTATSYPPPVITPTPYPTGGPFINPG